MASIDKLDGDAILQNELEVKNYLETILNDPEHYMIKAYERTGVSAQIRRTELVVHSFYVIFEEGDFHTLSFYGTNMGFYSEGAWIMDSNSDRESFIMYTESENKWDVIEIKTTNEIDIVETTKNILDKIKSNVTYYYKDHLDDRPNMDNCNTALYETLAEKSLLPTAWPGSYGTQ
ncbi:MAG: hypothetical protein LBH57_03985 [Treponema sp.]|nr:hypothetical protein [Treponema sp.]